MVREKATREKKVDDIEKTEKENMTKEEKVKATENTASKAREAAEVEASLGAAASAPITSSWDWIQRRSLASFRATSPTPPHSFSWR